MFGTYRTLLAVMVVALHLGGVPAIGSYAVFGFYILSGYLMTLIMQTNYGYSLSGLWRYGVNRFLRIYPLYWVSIALSLLLIAFVGERYATTYHSSLYLPTTYGDLLQNVFLIFPFRDSSRLTPPSWALTVELFYYVAIGLGASRTRTLAVGWLVVSVIYHVFVNIVGLGWQYKYFVIPAAALPFATGACIYHYKEQWASWPGLRWLLSSRYGAVYVVFAMFLNWAAGYLSGEAKGVFFYTNYGLCALMVFILAEQRSLPYISTRVDKWMGELSYPVYLMHYQIGLAVMYFMSATGVEMVRPNSALFLISLPIVLVFSWGVAAAVEKPIEILRSRFRRPEPVVR